MNQAVVRLCALALALCPGLFARPALAVPDIADFSLGITREETLLRAAVPCGDDLCGEVAFGGKVWGGTFRFRNDVLAVISLFGPLDDAYVEAAFEGFAESPYVVYRAVSDNAVFDFPSRAAEGQSPEALDAAFLEFLRGLRSAGCTFASYFYTEPAAYEAMRLEASEAAAPAPKKKAPAETGAPPPAPAADGAAGGARSAEGTAGPASLRKGAGAGANAQEAAGQPAPDGVVCNLTIDEGGIVIIIMSRADLRAEMAARAVRGATSAAGKADEGARARSASAQKP